MKSGETLFSRDEWENLTYLDSLIAKSGARSTIDAIAERVEQKLSAERDAVLAWDTVPVNVYGVELPEIIRSSWVFVLRANARSGAERHPNSHQRMMSYRGSGDLQTREGVEWRSHHLVSDAEAELGRRWISIAANVWHQAVVAGENWVVVSFHTVPAEELIEERPDPADPEHTRQRVYLDEAG